MHSYCSRKLLVAGIFFMLIIPLLLASCDQHEKIIGKYQSVDHRQDDPLQVTLELEANGKGLWSIESDNAPFRWDLHQNKIRLHTRSGGVIEGTIHNETIQIALPGMGDILFERIN